MWVLVVLGVIGLIYLWTRPAPQPPATHIVKDSPPQTLRGRPADTARLQAELDAQTAKNLETINAEAELLGPQIDAEAERLLRADSDIELWPERIDPPADEPLGTPRLKQASGPSGGPAWMSPAQWAERTTAYRRQGRTPADIAEIAAYLERRGPRTPQPRPPGQPVALESNGTVSGGGPAGMVVRSDYVPKEEEARFLIRDGNGAPTVRLVDAGDRLSIWSPVGGGALINPKGPGLRGLGLYSSYARGAAHYSRAYRAADLSKSRWVDLVRQPQNPHDTRAVAMCAPGSTATVGFVQRGRAPAIARRIDAGEDMAGVCMRGPAAGADDCVAFVLIGNRTDLEAMLTADR